MMWIWRKRKILMQSVGFLSFPGPVLLILRILKILLQPLLHPMYRILLQPLLHSRGSTQETTRGSTPGSTPGIQIIFKVLKIHHIKERILFENWKISWFYSFRQGKLAIPTIVNHPIGNNFLGGTHAPCTSWLRCAHPIWRCRTLHPQPHFSFFFSSIFQTFSATFQHFYG